jgi:ubiquinone/menaquinone biosynthesis C-methylase UbiE
VRLDGEALKVPCSAYTDPRLAQVYDPLNPPGQDEAFYLALAGRSPRTVLDVGCGTGHLAVDLAVRGHRTTGADPAAAMLAIARERPSGDKVTWIESSAAALDLATRFDLAIMTGHVFQVFLTDDEIRDALATLRRHLAPGGRLAFETRNPAARAWEQWTPTRTRRRVEVPGVGPVDAHYDVTASDGRLVRYETHFRFAADDVVISESILRFMEQAELAGFLAEAGFAHVAWHGDWDGSPVGATSPEIIAIAS